MKQSRFRFVPFSKKQKRVLTWWMDGSPHKDKDAIICDGSVRAGKTLIMSLSFVIWAMDSFCYQQFGMAGKTIGSFKRNVWFLLKILLRLRGYAVEERVTDSFATIRKGGIENYFYLFGGKDERSQQLVQGFTSAGFFFDEVALMPQSFVNQAVARCSVEGAKLWFNCNPDSPYHWFKLEWIDQLERKNALRIHFIMDDNPSLSKSVKERYKRMFSGIFYDRFILGLWVLAEGIIYDMWSDTENVFDDKDVPVTLKHDKMRYIVIDYGTTNPMVFLDIWDDGITVWQMDEYYYDSRLKGRQKTDSQYGDDFEKFVGDDYPIATIIDPSAASFKAELINRGYTVIDADNDVLDGIRMTSTMIGRRKFKIHRKCKHTIGELMSYIWDLDASKKGTERPIKEHDHAPDAIRYFVKTIIKSWRLAA